jgi:hypothetical protein
MTRGMTEEQAELTTKLAADLIETVGKPEYGDMPWLHSVAALSLACRGVAASVMSREPKMTLDQARTMMLREFLQVLHMPSGIIQVVDDGEDGDVKAEAIPVRKH